ncbi:MAG: Rieske 2Fe-2S domain-containing protein [Chloroflexia bacterium]
MALCTIVGCLVAFIFDPSAIIAEPLSMGLGYVALVYLVLSLLIGPLYLARRRRNPVNIYLRRDIGIWAGITSLLHVFFSLQIYVQGQILLYFFRQVQDHFLPQLNLFGFSNDVGLLAAVIVFVLLALSNDRALRWLKGKRWKRIQQWTYPLIVLTIIHTLGYQLYNERDGRFIWALVALTLIVGSVQGTGVLVYRSRASRSVQARTGARPTVSPVAVPALLHPTPESIAPFAPDQLSRRRFLVLSGVTLVTGMAAVVSFKVTEELLGPAGGDQSTSGSKADPTTAGDTASASPPTTAPGNTTAGANPTAANSIAPSPTDPGSGTNGGVILTTLAACPVNSAVNFTAPDTGESGILVREGDGSVKAFSNLCTHRPYPVEYDAGSQLLVCPLHLACFNAQTGGVTRGPARDPLSSINVHVDPQGNIVYG